MSIPTSNVVQLSVSVAAQAKSVNGFAAMLLLGISSVLPIGNRLQPFNSLDEVIATFGSEAPETLAATPYFEQSPQPATLFIGRRFNAAVPGELLGSQAPDTTLADYTAIATGALTLMVDGTAVNLTGINLTGLANLSAVAAAVQTKLVAVKAGSTCIWTGTQFIIRSGTTGTTSSVGFCTAPGVGVDLSPLMGLVAGSGAISTPGQAVETIQQTLANMQGLSAAWFYFTFTSEVLFADIMNAAAWAQANQVMGGQTITSGVAFLADITQNPGAACDELDYSNFVFQYDPVDPYAICSFFGRCVTVNYDQPDSTICLKFKQEPGMTPLNLSPNQQAQLEANNINYNAFFGDNNAMIAEGVVANGRFVDEVVGLAWLQWAVQNDIFAYQYAARKIPQTDKGVARIRQVITKRMDSAVANGLLAPGTWEGEEIDGTDGTAIVKQGDFLKNGYIVYAAPVSTQTQTKRASRIYDLFTVVAKGAGAIQDVGIAMTFEA
jgi:hypothetical protein